MTKQRGRSTFVIPHSSFVIPPLRISLSFGNREICVTLQPMHLPSLAPFLALLALSTLGVAEPQMVSVAADGTLKPGNSREPSISSDGRYVAFSTTARLTSDDRNTISDVYVRDRVAKTTRRVSD